jgi:hypothetical protein
VLLEPELLALLTALELLQYVQPFAEQVMRLNVPLH